MSNAAFAQETEQRMMEEYKVTRGYFGERMYYIDFPAEISKQDEDIFNRLIYDNQGVGIIVGQFDEKLSIRMISAPSGRALGYTNASDFLSDSQGYLTNLVSTEKEQEYLRNKLTNPDDEIWGFSLKGRDNKSVSVRIRNVVKTAQNGELMWYMSIRKFGDSQFDSVTGGLNRYGFIRQLKRLKDNGIDLKDYAILFTNIKGFKAINDVFGSAVGDKLLMQMYNHYTSSELNPLICSRQESDKFLLLVKRENLNLETLHSVLSLSFSIGEKIHGIECICGVYYIENDDMEASTMIDCAKLAKQYITDIFVSPYAVFKPDMRTRYIERSNALARFEEALLQNEFVVLYQPIVDCKTERPVSAEALVRWQSKKHGLVSPGAFIPALEENGSIIKLDQYVYRRAANLLLKRIEQNEPIIPISVNFSRMDFFDEKRIDKLYERLEQDALARKYIHFELTESSHHTIRHAQTDFIRRINALGGMVYIDDFGTAYSSLDMLSEYDFSILKLDMRFVKGMVENPKLRSLTRSTIDMAHGLGIKVVAEGVETKEQFNLLRVFGCDYIQGYYFSMPLMQDEFEAYLAKHLNA